MVLLCQDCSPIQTPGPASNVEEEAAIPVDKERNIFKIVKEEIFYTKVVVPFATLIKTRRRKR